MTTLYPTFGVAKARMLYGLLGAVKDEADKQLIREKLLQLLITTNFDVIDQAAIMEAHEEYLRGIGGAA